MTKDEFQNDVDKIVNILGEEAVMFLMLINNMEEYFLKADEEFYGTTLTPIEFEEIGENIKDVLGQEEGKRFFKAILDTLPTQTVTYLSILVKLFELGENEDNIKKFPIR
jgi:hypothetical protein